MIGAFLITQGLEVVPGTCTFCGDPAPSSGPKPAIVCSDRECRATYQRLYGQFVRGRAPLREITQIDHPRSGTWTLALDCGHARTVHRSTRPPWRSVACLTCASEVKRAA